MGVVTSFRELRVYRDSFRAARRIFDITRRWPRSERYDLTSQIRRSSRSVCANLAEAWRRRQYPKHFASKLVDSSSEAAETRCWLDFALDCEFITQAEYTELDEAYDDIQASLTAMLTRADQWCGPARKT